MRIRNFSIVFLGLLFSALSILNGCKKESENITEKPKTGAISFANDVQPIFTANCVKCHPKYNDYTAISKEASVILGAIESGTMPKGGPKLSDNTIATVRLWIDEGKKNN